MLQALHLALVKADVKRLWKVAIYSQEKKKKGQGNPRTQVVRAPAGVGCSHGTCEPGASSATAPAPPARQKLGGNSTAGEGASSANMPRTPAPPNLNFKGSMKARVIETLKSSGTSAVITASSPLYRVPVYLSC